MKWRIFFTAFFVYALSLAMYEEGKWLASDGFDVASRNLIPVFAAIFIVPIIWAIWNLELRRTEQSKTRSAKAVNEDTNLEKRKRERLDSVLRDLSDADLLRLRQRLTDGTINNASLEEALIGEDGELLRERRR
jgi:hypothetical protein